MASRRPAQAWPAFTKHIIPALYEYLRPFYTKPGRLSTKRDELEIRPALFPRELLEDMLAILRLEHHDTFGGATTEQLKAVIQRHLDRRPGSYELFKIVRETAKQYFPLRIGSSRRILLFNRSRFRLLIKG